jgi:hypothetical protein
MTPSRPASKDLKKHAKSLEESFFAKENERLLKKMREKAAREEKRKAFRESLNLDNDEVIDALIDLALEPQTVAAFSIVPLVKMAWADGKIQPKERTAILKAAKERGIEPGSDNYELLESWLEREPKAGLMSVWQGYVDALRESLDPMLFDALKERVLTRTKAVAEAAGGFLGIGSISKAEQAMLDRLEESLK